MNMLVKRRQLVMATMVVALGAAVFVNWYFTRPDVSGAKATSSSVKTNDSKTVNLGDAELVNATTKKSKENAKANDKKDAKSKDTAKKVGAEYFAEAKLNRNKAHDKSIESLNEVISNKQANKEAVNNASEDLTKITNTIKKEADVENLIKAKVKSECIVVINEEKVEVVIEKKILNENVIMQIKDIVIKNCNVSSDNITLIEVK